PSDAATDRVVPRLAPFTVASQPSSSARRSVTPATGSPPARRTVSGVRAARGSVHAARTTCGRDGSVVGAAAHCASAPATSGPSPNPSVIAPLARRAPAPGGAASYGGVDSSLIHAVPALNALPLAIPITTRPAKSHPTPCDPHASTPPAT